MISRLRQRSLLSKKVAPRATDLPPPERGRCCNPPSAPRMEVGLEGALANQIDPAMLRKLLRYEPETGKLFWLPRDEAHFLATGDSRGSGWSCRAWNAKNANRQAFTAISNGYPTGAIFGKNFGAHRVAWALYYGAWPEKVIDHINGDPADNRIVNLRDVSSALNQRNSKLNKRNASGHPGICWDKSRKRWSAEIGGGHYKRHLGRFCALADAISARREAEKALSYHPNHGRVV